MSTNLQSLPPLTAIRAFEAAARLQSFTGAAGELNMTQAAVSYQIKQLERRLGVVLFRRLARKVVLTQAGEQLAPAVSKAFVDLTIAFSQVVSREESEIAVTALPTVASCWLAPRLGLFQAQNPRLTVRLQALVPLGDFDRGDFDVGVRSGLGDWPGLEATWLLPNVYTPLCSPAVRDAAGGLADPRELLGLRLLGRPNWWRFWFESQGLTDVDLTGRDNVALGVEQYDITAAIAGHGVAIASPLFFQRELAVGELVAPFAHIANDGRGYWLVYREGAATTTKVRAFKAWIVQEAAASRALLPDDVLEAQRV
ncbi:MAG: LysR substrate-binding domain-containing protein [Pseudomonadota bacterium]